MTNPTRYPGQRPAPNSTLRPGKGFTKKRKAVNPRNTDRVHRKRGGAPGDSDRHTYGARFEFVSGLPCCVPGCGVVDGAPADHWVPVGRGGMDRHCIPVCADHQDRHQLGEDTWLREYGVDIQLVLAETRAAWAEFRRGAA